MNENAVLVIGNGESRKGIDLQKYIGKITTVGCNAVHRETIVDHLICCDQRMVRESLNNVNIQGSLVYVREEWYHTFKKLMKHKNVRPLPDLPYQGTGRADAPRNWGSGTYAHLLASTLDFQRVYMLGFDLYGKGSLVNNIYKNTPNYSVSRSHAIDPAYWIYQSGKIFQHFSNKEFIIINSLTWSLPDLWKLPNVKFLDLDNFLLSNIEDL